MVKHRCVEVVLQGAVVSQEEFDLPQIEEKEVEESR